MAGSNNKLLDKLLGLGVFLIAGFFATNYTINHFYVTGGYMLDSGWFAHLAAHASSWPLSNPPSLGGTYFSTHFSPAFYVYSAGFGLLNSVGAGITEAAWFAITQGLWVAIMAAACFSLLSPGSGQGLVRSTCVAIIALMLAYNGVTLASLGFPHFEIAIPALLVAFFALYLNGHPKLALSLLVLGLLMREDAGLHYFGLFFVFSIYLYFANERRLTQQVKAYTILALVCLLYSATAIGIQKLFFGSGDDALRRVYLGDPAYAHVSLAFLLERLSFFLQNRLYIVIPFALMIGLAAYKKNWGPLVGIVAVTPWITFNLLAVQDQAGGLRSYYSFPVALALLWPAVAYRVLLQTDGQEREQPVLSLKVIALLALSAVAFYPGSQGNHDPAPWKSFGPRWAGHVQSAHKALDAFVESNVSLNLLFDDAVASLLSSKVSAVQWRYLLSFGDDTIKGMDAVVYQPGAWLEERVKEVAAIAGLNYRCRIPDTPYAVLARSQDVRACTFPDTPATEQDPPPVLHP